MKQKLIIALFTIGVVSCGQQQPTYTTMQLQPQMVIPSQQYQVLQGPNGAQQVAFYDNGMQQMMEYTMFMSLMNNGGYNNVIHHYHEPYYHTHVYNSRSYGSWSRQSPRSYQDGTSVHRQVTTTTTTNITTAPKTSSWKTTPSSSSYRTSSSRSFGGGRRR